MRCATCCRRSQPCSMVASVATRSSGCRSCARPVSARGSSMPRAAPCRWTSTVSSKKCCRSSISRPTSFRRSVQDELIGQMSELLGIDYDVLALDLTESEPPPRPGQRPNPPSAPPTLPEPGAIARAPIEPAPSPLQQHLLQATLRPRRRGPRTMRPRARHPRPALRQRLAVCLTSTSSLRHPRRNVSSPSSAWSPTSWAMCCRPTSRPTYCSRFPCRPGPLSHLGHLAYRPWPRHTRPPAHPHRAVRARDRGRGRPGRMCRGSF